MPTHRRTGPVRLAAACALLILLLAGARVFRAYRVEARDWAITHEPVPMPPDSARLGLESVTFPSRDRTALRGWYAPSRTGAAVILCHGSTANRAQMLPQARALAMSGLGALLFDWPGEGESGGMVQKGASERAALEGAVDYLLHRSDVADGRVGAVGFSLGSYILAQTAAADQRVRAVVLEGAYGDPDEQTRAEFASGGRLAEWGALLADHLSGRTEPALFPIRLVGGIAPRPLLIVAGDADRTVPEGLSRRLFAAAREPKILWIVHGADHGQYAERDPTFLPRLADFLTQALR